MNFNIKIDKKHFFILLGAILILAGAIYGYAYGGFDPESMGHSFEELEGVQARVSGSCSAGSSIRAINASGGVTCETDDVGMGYITGITAGTGMTGGGISGSVTLNANTSYLQARVSGSCSAGSSIRAINANGGVTCETDDSGGGGGGGLSDCKTITATYTGEIEKSCSSGYIAVVASCKMGSDTVVNGEFPSAPGSSSGYTQYLIPNTNSATGVHCDTFGSTITSQLHLRCCR